MSRRKKRKNKRSSPNKLTPQQLELQAKQALSSQHYKVAIQHLKILLKKTGKTDSIRALLQQAYTGRAEELASAKMIKEAVAIWDIAIEYGVDPLDSRYLGWIVHSQQIHRLIKIYQQIDASKKLSLQPQLAVICLSGNVSVLKKLAEDDPVYTGYQVAMDLLQAWCAGENAEQLRNRMKAISFRSPYRDLRQVIQAWILLEESPDKANKAVERIAENSPFYPLAEQVQLAQLAPSDFIEKIPSLPTNTKSCALEIRDWTDVNSNKVVKKLVSLPENPSAQALSTVLLALCKQLKKDQLTPEQKHWLFSIAKKMWAVSGGTSFKKLALSVGELTVLEKKFLSFLRLIAKKENVNYVSSFVEKYLQELKDAPKNDITTKDKALISSLLNHYLFEQWKEYDRNKITPYSVKFLEQSLIDDPSDDVAWAELLEYRLEQAEIKPARDDSKMALEHHPDNIKLLDLAIRVAIMGNAFVKAAGYAQRILAVDPINSSAQQHLQHAHLSHARKQIKQKKWHLVDRELEKAEQWKSSALTATLIDVVRAYQIQTEKGIKAAAAAFQSLAKTTTLDKTAVDFIIRHQGEALNLPYKANLRSAKLAAFWNKPDKDKVLALIDIVQQLRAIDANSVQKPFESLVAPLKKAVKLAYSAKEGEQICEFLMQIENDQLLQEYADKLRKKYKDKPIFVYYYYVNKKGIFHSMAELEAAWDIAKEQGDDVATALLVGLLEKHSNPFATPFFDDDDDEDIFDPFSDLFEDLSEKKQEMFDVISAMKEIVELDKDDIDDITEEKKVELLVNLLPIMPEEELFNVADDIFGRKYRKKICNKFDSKKLRECCKRCLEGEDPDDILTELKIVRGIRLPFIGDLF